MVGWALNNAVDLVFRKQETRIVCVPAGFAENLHAVALKELASSSRGPGEDTPFVSEGDVLTALVTRLAEVYPECPDALQVRRD